MDLSIIIYLYSISLEFEEIMKFHVKEEHVEESSAQVNMV